MKAFIYITLLLSFSVFSQEEKFVLSTVAFYNVENLFDAVDDPKNSWDQNWLNDGVWNEEIYQQKLNNISLPVLNYKGVRFQSDNYINSHFFYN